MDSSAIIVLCVYVIITMNIFHFALGLQEPLYLTKSSSYALEYSLIHVVRFDATNKQFFLLEPYGYEILLACPRRDNPDSLEIRQKVSKTTTFSPYCETPVKSHVYMLKSRFAFLTNVIGFPVFIPNRNPIHQFANVPKNHTVVALLHFEFDKSLRRVIMVRYQVAAGKFLKPEISNNNKEYQKDENIFRYDVDLLYSQTELPLVKVPLAPEENFFFENWKSASRHNIITAPMWKHLLPQWQALEIFILKVTQIIDSVQVKAGVYDTLTKPGPDGTVQKMYLHDGNHPIPEYFWKAVYIEIHLGSYHCNKGILFVMHNVIVDPNTESNEHKICPNDDISNTGWDFQLDDPFKSLIYGCFFSKDNMEIFKQEMLPANIVYEPFDLHDVPVREINDEGRTTGVKNVNVIKEIQESENARTGDNQE